MLRLSWIALVAIHFLPAIAVFRPALLTTLYGIDRASPVFLLLWHRAALFLVVVIVGLWAAFRPEVRQLASVAIAVSMLSFLALYLANGSPASLRVIALADLAGLPFLAFVAWSAFRH